MPERKRHKKTSVSLHLLSFEDSIKLLSQSPKHEDSEAEESDRITEVAPESGPSGKAI